MGRSRRTPAGSGMGKAGKFPRLALAALVTVATVVVFTKLQGFGVRYKPSDRLEGLSVHQKFRLFDAYIQSHVFETSVGRVPVLQDLFREFEKLRKYAVPGLNLADYDESCNGYYQDSLSDAFDVEPYAQKEEDVKVNFFKGGAKPCDGTHRHGCCFAKHREDACLCLYDGRRDLVSEVLDPSGGALQAASRMARSLALSKRSIPEYKNLQDLYGRVLMNLGLHEDPASRRFKLLIYVKNLVYMPPGGFLMWHTNRYDNDRVSYRLYMTSTDVDGGSYFKYWSEREEKIMKVHDFHGAVRLFTNTMKSDEEAGEPKYLWHTVASETAHRFSIGFEILPDQIIALLDSCGGCWDGILATLKE